MEGRWRCSDCGRSRQINPSPVGATSAPASEPTTEADGVRYFAEACVEAAGKLGNDNGLDTKLNATAALLGEYAARLASQASALAAAEQTFSDLRQPHTRHTFGSHPEICNRCRGEAALVAPPAGGTGGATA